MFQGLGSGVGALSRIDSMSTPLEIWADTGKDGNFAGLLHWARFSKGTLCGKDATYPTDFNDMQAALRAGREGAYDVYPCGACGALNPDA